MEKSWWKFNLRSCPALLDKQKAKKEALAAQTQNESSPEAKRPRRDSDGKQNVKEPFKPPYVEELYVGTLEGIEGEEGMSILVRPCYSFMDYADV
jgi:ATP adenylyltransferase